jgi:hypothetical protein
VQEAGSKAGPVVGAALIAALALLTAVLAGTSGGSDPAQRSADTTTSSLSGGPAGTPPAARVPVDQDAMQRADLAIIDDEKDQIVLITFDGTELGRGARAGWYPTEPDRGVDIEPDGTLGQAPVLDDPLPGCEAVHGRGGMRVAVCGANGSNEITVVGADNTSRLLAGPVTATGRWRYAVPSPDGRWVLAQWSGECEVPTAYLLRVEGGPARPVFDHASESSAAGWSSDGRAVVALWPGSCGSAAEQPGTYLVDPNSGQRRRTHPGHQAVIVSPVRGFYATRMERIMGRALDELGVTQCCAQPSHGGDDAETGFEFEGHEISVYAEPVNDTAPAVRLDSGELRFACGSGRYRLRDWGPPGADGAAPPDRSVLRRAAQRLISRLYCTAGPMAFTP